MLQDLRDRLSTPAMCYKIHIETPRVETLDNVINFKGKQNAKRTTFSVLSDSLLYSETILPWVDINEVLYEDSIECYKIFHKPGRYRWGWRSDSVFFPGNENFISLNYDTHHALHYNCLNQWAHDNINYSCKFQTKDDFRLKLILNLVKTDIKQIQKESNILCNYIIDYLTVWKRQTEIFRAYDATAVVGKKSKTPAWTLKKHLNYKPRQLKKVRNRKNQTLNVDVYINLVDKREIPTLLSKYIKRYRQVEVPVLGAAFVDNDLTPEYVNSVFKLNIQDASLAICRDIPLPRDLEENTRGNKLPRSCYAICENRNKQILDNIINIAMYKTRFLRMV